jgi:hypothetical protein
MKSGSTTLHELLAEHPELCMSEPKEPCYFVDAAVLKAMWPEMWQLGYWKSEAAYLHLFQGKPQARYFGESSTDYSKSPKFEGVAERIAEFSPDARILYIMRDPVERTISHYWHMVEHRGETRSPLQAIREEPHYMEVSHYALQLAPYIERFGIDNIYTMTFEELTRAPLQAVQMVYEWLGVQADFVPQALTAAHNVTPAMIQQQRAGMTWLQRLRHSWLWDQIGPLIPAQLRRYGVAMAEKPIRRKEVDMAEVVAFLRPIQQAQAQVLSGMLGRTFPEWKRLHAD